MKRKRATALLIAGCGALVIALTLVTRLHNDLATGISFGVAFGLMLGGVVSLVKGKSPGA